MNIVLFHLKISKSKSQGENRNNNYKINIYSENVVENSYLNRKWICKGL